MSAFKDTAAEIGVKFRKIREVINTHDKIAIGSGGEQAEQAKSTLQNQDLPKATVLMQQALRACLFNDGMSAALSTAFPRQMNVLAVEDFLHTL
jgi:hypothetical protein